MSRIAEMVFEDLVARGKDVKTARHWRNWAEKFVGCCGEKDGYERADVIKYLAMLRGEGHKQNSINTMLRPIKLLCQVQQWKGDFPRLAMQKVKDDEVNRPILSYDEVVEMIRGGKKLLSGRELACLAFSTTYGLRREELTDLEIGVGNVRIDVVKGGNPTIQTLPDEIKDYIGGYGKSDIYYMTKLFKKMVVKLEMKLNGRAYGWHSIRRRLITELVLREASAINIVRFIRWSDAMMKGEFGMLALYAQKDQARIDSEIFKVHPFLPVWAEKD